METYKTDEEQIEAVKQWWKENGIPIVVGLVIGLSAIFGWRGWQAYQQQQAEAASDIYQTMINSIRNKDDESARDAARQLQDDYGSTSYAIYAALNLAKLDVKNRDFAGARKQLEYAGRNAPTRELRLLADVRLARVLLEQEDPDAALKLLGSRDFGKLSAIAEELKGDILSRQGNTDAAKKAYNTALAMTTPGSNAHELLSLKLESVSAPVN